MEYHVRTFYVEGLDLAQERFVWNNKMMFMDAGTKGGNIAEVHILLDRTMPDQEGTPELEIDQVIRDNAEGLHLLGIFLACLRLSNIAYSSLRINRTMSGGYSIHNLDDFRLRRQNHNPFLSTKLNKNPVDVNINALENTVPLFEKVVKNIKFNEKKPKNPLAISLPIFQRIRGLEVESVIDYVTVLESLVCENESELKFKFALRTSLLVEKNSKNRKDLFPFLRKVYNIRSNLVHGSEISLELFSREHAGIILDLETVVEHALIEYIELIHKGLSKKEIIEKLDNMALGLSDDS